MNLAALAFTLAFAPMAALACAPGVECAPPGESEAIRSIAAQTLIRYGHDLALRPPAAPALRDAHANAHGCVAARLQVVRDVPEALRVGLFAVPGDHAAVIRFSNGAALPANDHRGDGRGMAVKLTGIANAPQGQDFLMINHPVFFVRDAADYTGLTRAIAEDRGAQFLATHPVEARIAAATARPIDDVLEQRYFSQVPYRLGARFVKFAAFPAACSGDEPPTPASLSNPDGADFLAARLYQRLATAPACFDFALQPQTDPATDRIEDATSEWRGPFHTVAHIRIETAQPPTHEQTQACENLQFSPWHSLEAHAPAGGINRVRRVIYPVISDLRHRLNATIDERKTP